MRVRSATCWSSRSFDYRRVRARARARSRSTSTRDCCEIPRGVERTSAELSYRYCVQNRNKTHSQSQRTVYCRNERKRERKRKKREKWWCSTSWARDCVTLERGCFWAAVRFPPVTRAMPERRTLRISRVRSRQILPVSGRHSDHFSEEFSAWSPELTRRKSTACAYHTSDVADDQLMKDSIYRSIYLLIKWFKDAFTCKRRVQNI